MTIALTYADLITPQTEDEALQNLLAFLEEQGFAATSWQSDDPILTILMAIAKRDSHVSQMIAFYALNSHNATATNDEMLDQISQSDFNNTRNVPVAARFVVQMSLVAGGIAVSKGIGATVISTADGRVTFRNLEAYTISAGASSDVLFECETAGVVGNVGTNTITNMVTTIAGVSCNNPTAQTVNGRDKESNDALRLRNSQKWPTLSLENTNDAIESLIKSLVPSITSVAINDSNPRGAGTVDIYCAGQLAESDGADVAAAQVVARNRYFNPDPRIQCFAATPQTWSVSGTILYASTLSPTQIQNAVVATLRQILIDLPIGGRSYQGGDSHVLLRDDVINALKATSGVISASLSGSGNYSVGKFSKLVPPVSWSLTYTPSAVL